MPARTDRATFRPWLCALGLVCGLLVGGAGASELQPDAAPAARPKIALVLSGGGARGMAHIGVLQVLEELRVPVDIVVGTSFGAIVGGAYAGGADVAELEKLVLATDWTKVMQDRPPRDELNYRRREDDAMVSSRLEFGVSKDGLTLPRGAFTSAEVERLLRLLTPSATLLKLPQLPLVYRAVSTDMLTGEMVVPVDVSLFTAMRASMSVPGAFAPITVDGRILGDGGLVSNLPVALARELGADVVIAVNLGTPLGGPEALADALGMAQQMINILIEQNVQRSLRELTPRDVLIVPDLAGVNFMQFDQIPRSIAAGAAAAREHAARLSQWSVADESYAAYRQQRSESHLALAGNAPKAATVRVEPIDYTGTPVPAPKDTAIRPGDPVSPATINAAAARTVRELNAERVDTLVLGDGATREVVLLPIGSPLGQSRLRLGISLESDNSGNNDFTLSGLYTLERLNALGAEWRTLGRIGDTDQLDTEWYQPLGGGSPWYAAAHGSYRGYDANLYDEEDFSLAAIYRVQSSSVGVAFGRRIWDAGTVDLGARYRWLRLSPTVLSPDIIEAQGDGPLTFEGQTYTANVTFDTLDSLGFPTRGYLASLGVEYFGAGGDPVGDAYTVRLDSLYAATHGAWAGHVYAAAVRSNVGLFPLTLGGFLRLSGAPTSSILGDEVVFGRVVAARQIGVLPAAFGGALRAGISLETGRAGAFGDMSSAQTRYGGSAFVVADTRFGPVYLAVGNTKGVGTAAYLFLGSVLLPTGLIQ
jgi:NTE family protein